MKKTDILAITIISLLVWSLITGSIFFWLDSIHYIDRSGANLGNYKLAEPVDFAAPDQVTISQEILSQENHLGRIIFPIRVSQASELLLTLRDSAQNTIDQKTIVAMPPSPSSKQFSLVTWEFKPIADSESKLYTLTIVKKTAEPATFFTIPADQYDGGVLYINGQADGQKRIILDWQYYTKSPVNIIIGRLGYAKPGLLGQRTTPVILLVIFFLMMLGVIWLLTYLTIFRQKQLNQEPSADGNRHPPMIQ